MFFYIRERDIVPVVKINLPHEKKYITLVFLYPLIKWKPFENQQAWLRYILYTLKLMCFRLRKAVQVRVANIQPRHMIGHAKIVINDDPQTPCGLIRMYYLLANIN